MAGTSKGGKKTAKINRKKYGKDFYQRIGAKGGRNGHTGGFASDKVGKDGLTGKQRAKVVGQLGGFASDRTGVKTGETKVKRRKHPIVPWGEEK